MQKKTKIFVALVALLTLSLVVPASLAAAGSKVHGKDFTFVERTGTATGTPSGNGDRVVFMNTLYDEANEDQIGYSYGDCVVVNAREGQAPEMQCVVTAKLPGGQLTAQGVTDFASDSSPFAITGGTGKYAKARGEAIVHNESETTSRIDIHL